MMMILSTLYTNTNETNIDYTADTNDADNDSKANTNTNNDIANGYDDNIANTVKDNDKNDIDNANTNNWMSLSWGLLFPCMFAPYIAMEVCVAISTLVSSSVFISHLVISTVKLLLCII